MWPLDFQGKKYDALEFLGNACTIYQKMGIVTKLQDAEELIEQLNAMWINIGILGRKEMESQTFKIHFKRKCLQRQITERLRVKLKGIALLKHSKR